MAARGQCPNAPVHRQPCHPFVNPLVSRFMHGSPFLPGSWTRRQFLARNAMGVGSVALAWLLAEERLLATPASVPRGLQHFDLKPKQPHFAPQARAMISLLMHGGPSHVDLLDPKPELSGRSGGDYAG